MNLYLSSYQVGNQASALSEMFAGPKRIGVIRNALDYSDDKERLKNGRDREFGELRSVGLAPEDIELRDYFDRKYELSEKLENLDGLWGMDGNAFILRRAVRQSGLDKVWMNKLRDESFVYAGYNAGTNDNLFSWPLREPQSVHYRQDQSLHGGAQTLELPFQYFRPLYL